MVILTHIFVADINDQIGILLLDRPIAPRIQFFVQGLRNARDKEQGAGAYFDSNILGAVQLDPSRAQDKSVSHLFIQYRSDSVFK